MNRTSNRRPKLWLSPASRERWFACARVLLGALLLAALLVAPNARAYTLFRCNYGAVVMTSCCCPSTQLPHQGPPELSRASCCTVEHVAGALGAGTVCESKAQAGLPRVALSASLSPAPRRVLAVHAVRNGTDPGERFRKPPRAGPPLTIAYQRFLI